MLPEGLIRVLVWSEGPEPRDVYGAGIRHDVRRDLANAVGRAARRT